MLDREIEDAKNRGLTNQKVMDLVSNWCAHIRFEYSPFLGVGMIERMYNLPVSGREIHCDHERAAPLITVDMAAVALDFYDRNCIDCPHRIPVAYPNLSVLVGERDKEWEMHREIQEKIEVEKLEKRNRRAGRRSPATPLRNSLLDDIDALEGDDATEAFERLQYVASTKPGTFDQDVIDSLLEFGTADTVFLAASTRPATPDLVKLLVERKPSNPKHIDFLATHINVIPDDALSGAITYFSNLTLERSHAFDRRTPRTELLIETYKRIPDVVEEQVGFLLASENPFERDTGMSAAITLIDFSPDQTYEEVRNFVQYALTIGIEAPSKNYLEKKLLRKLLERWPDPAIQICADLYENGEKSDRELLTGALTLCLRDGVENDTGFNEDDSAKIFGYLMTWALADGDGVEDHHLTEFLRDHATHYPRQLSVHFDRLLGTLILYPDRIEATRKRTILVPKEIEEGNSPQRELRHMALKRRMNEILKIISESINILPEKAGASVIELLESDAAVSLGELMCAQLLRTLQGASGVRTLYKRLFPLLMKQMLGNSVLLRANAILVYGEVCKVDADAVPENLHESFLLSAKDRYLAVISAFVKVVSSGKVLIQDPEWLKETLANWALNLGETHQDDELLIDILKEIRSLFQKERNYFDRFALKLLLKASPEHVWDYLNRTNTALTNADYTSLWFRLSLDPSIYHSDHDILRTLKSFTKSDFSKFQDQIVSLCNLDRDNQFEHDLLDQLLKEEHLEPASSIVGEMLRSVPNTEAFLPRRIYLETIGTYCSLEIALLNGNVQAAEAMALELKRLEEIRKDDEERNGQRRDFDFGRTT